MSGIYSCKDCVAPIRHAGCHATCEKYLTEKAAYDKEKEQYNREHTLGGYRTNTDGTYRISKRNRKKR